MEKDNICQPNNRNYKVNEVKSPQNEQTKFTPEANANIFSQLDQISPFLKNLIIEKVLGADPETFDTNRILSDKEYESVTGFLMAMQYQRQKAPRRERRRRVSGHFSRDFKSNLLKRK